MTVLPYVVVPYADRMDLAYAAADLVVCARRSQHRLPSSPPSGCPAVYVPLPIGNGEQRLNARDVVSAGGGLLVDDDAFDPGWIDSRLIPLLRDPGRVQALARAAASAGDAHGDEHLADLVDEAFASRSARG